MTLWPAHSAVAASCVSLRFGKHTIATPVAHLKPLLQVQVEVAHLKQGGGGGGSGLVGSGQFVTTAVAQDGLEGSLEGSLEGTYGSVVTRRQTPDARTLQSLLILPAHNFKNCIRLSSIMWFEAACGLN